MAMTTTSTTEAARAARPAGGTVVRESVQDDTRQARTARPIGAWATPSARQRLALIELARLRSGRAWAVPTGFDEELGELLPPVVDVPGSRWMPRRPALASPRPAARGRWIAEAPQRQPMRAARPRRTGVGSGVRLTVLGQVAVVVVLAIAVIGAAVLTNLGRSSGSPVSSDAQVSVSVEPGDTLYSIARRWAPGADPAEMVAAMLVANDMTSADAAALQPGQKVLVPVL